MARASTPAPGVLACRPVLTADPLKQPFYVQLRLVEADLLPGEPEQPARADLRLPMRRSNSVKVGSPFGVPCRVVNTRPVSTQPSPECSRSVSCSCLRSLSAATQGQGEEAELLIPRSWQGCHRSCRPTRWTCWLTRDPAFTRARDGCLIHRMLRVTQPISKHVVCETLTGR